jgi:serine/threonine protein kinase
MRRMNSSVALLGLILIGSVLAGYVILMASLLEQWDPADASYPLARLLLYAILAVIGAAGVIIQIRLVRRMLMKEEGDFPTLTSPLPTPIPIPPPPMRLEKSEETPPPNRSLLKNKSFGRYRIQQQVGVGGMAIVYLALDPAFDRYVAIKVLPAHLCANSVSRERFRREAYAIAALEHTAAVPVYDFGEEQGQPYLVMRYLAGGSLQDHLQAAPLSLAATVNILRRIIPALAKAHGMGMIHRDIKPGNILFDEEENPYLTDFGLVKMLEGEESLSRSEFFGTPVYASPEQCSGDHEIDGRSDIYSLTAMLFRMITGFAPYSGSAMVVMSKHIHDPIPRVSEYCANLPAGLQAVIDRGMAKVPIERFSTVGELAAALEEIFPLPNLGH